MSNILPNSLFIFIIDYNNIMTAKEKTKFRASSKWKKFRIFNKKDHKIIDRLVEVLDRMEEYDNDL